MLAAVLVGTLLGALGISAPAHADRTWTKNGCTMRAVVPYIYWNGSIKNFVARTSLVCQYTQPSIKVTTHLAQYRGLGVWTVKKSNELRAHSTTSASVAAIWRCADGNQLYHSGAAAYWGLNDEYSNIDKSSEGVRLTC